MCRLCGFTFTDHAEYKAHWLDRLLLVSQTDENQSDGWGITDGVDLWKSDHMYSSSTPKWFKDIRANHSLMAHIRKASAGTGKTTLEAHPYKLDISIEHGPDSFEFQEIYCAHNGKIDGTVWNLANGAPNTDSYRAFLSLVTIMSRDGHTQLSAELFSQWLSEFTDTSQLAMLFHYGGDITALRKERPLHYSRLGDGYVIHTSKDVLEVFRRYIRSINGVESGDIIEIPKDHMVVFPTGNDDITQTPVQIKMRTYYTNYAKNAVTPTVPMLPPPRQETDEEMSGGKQIVHAPSVTKPKKERIVTRKTETVTTDKEREGIIANLVNFLGPLRQNLIWFWAVCELGYGIKSVSAISTEDLQLWRGMLRCHTFSKNGKDFIDRPYTPRQYVLINQWNHVVRRDKDSLLQEYWLGDVMFWLSPRYLELEQDMEAQQLLVADIAQFTFNNDLFECWSLSADMLEQIKNKDGNFDISELQQ